ncbi:uncharacterized protein LOC116264456 [Nymphaea colorata]|uniref:uncharacterized protein LOC116264456 n=1 Tax=Nymphaea colorata TaxID=210225 RepID=UPI00129E7E52|nr:uncharacterized protein LOC116264456 [Nymphaea colorata]
MVLMRSNGKTCSSDHQSKLFHVHPYEPQNDTETSLREAFSLVHSRLKPPFSPSLLSQTDYILLNRALLYGILTQSPLARIHYTHLCAIVTDGYKFFIGLLLKMVNDTYMKLLQPVKAQVLWVCDRLIDAEAAGIDELLVYLLRQIIGGDYSSENLWLSNELILVLRRNWEWVLGHEFLVGASVYSFLRLLADHYRLASQSVDALKQNELGFCIMVLRKHFGMCLSIGRDLVRLLQDVAIIPEFQTLWMDLLTNPSAFGVLGFSDISHIYRIRTSTRYLSLRITPEMESNLRFLLTNVKWGNQKSSSFP